MNAACTDVHAAFFFCLDREIDRSHYSLDQ